MSIWSSEAVLDAVLEAIDSVHLNSDVDHCLGRPFLTAYQLAIKIDATHPNISAALNVDIGGRHTGSHNSLAQYLGRELSRRIRDCQADDPFPVEGAFLSNEHLRSLTYVTTEGRQIESSLAGTTLDMSMFRRRRSCEP